MDNLDDLFGDGDADGINAALAAASLDTDALFQRIERSHLVGCCQRLAWSKTGGVAYISSDCRTIIIRALIRDNKSAKWFLSEEAPEVNASDDTIFTHVEWGSSGLELVATDQYGRLNLFGLSYALNRLQRQPMNLSTSVDDLGQIVGLHWLPVNLASQARTALIFPAKKEGNRWLTNMRLHEMPGVSNPLENKAAFLCLNRRNVLKLIYQQSGQPWSEQSVNLGNLTDSGDILTHAAFCQAPNHLVMVTCDASKRLRLYRIRINWNAVQGDATHHHSINPHLDLQHVELLERCVPSSSDRAAGAQLSALHLVPPSPNIENSTFTILAVFTSASPDNGSKYSVVSRWELRQAADVLHDSFRNLKSTSSQAAAPKAVTKIERQEDVLLQKAVLTIQSHLYNNIFAFASSDGMVEFRSRDSMQVIAADGDGTRATSLPQNGFAYMASDCIEFSLSPSMATSVITKPDGSVQLHNAEFIHGWADATLENDLAQAAIVSLARELGIVTCYQSGFDDLLSMIPTYLDVGLRRKFIAEIFRTVTRNVDFSLEDPKIQSTKVLKDSLMHRIMSAQLVISYQSDPVRRDVPAKMAWVLLNLRSVCTSIAQTLAMAAHPQGGKMEVELLISLKGVAKWSLDLMTMMFDDLLEIMRLCKGKVDREKILKHVHSKNMVPLHMLLCSSSRSLLAMLASILRNYFPRCIKAQEKARNNIRDKDELQLLEAMGTTELPFNIKSFEYLVTETDSLVRETYKSAQASAQRRNIYEQGMLVDAEIPEAMTPVLQKLFGEVVPRIESQIDGVGVYCTETAWLGLAEDEEANKRLERSTPFDVLRKCAIPIGRKKRKCRRCGSAIEDAVDGPAWVHKGNQSCVCLNHWIVA